MSKTWHNNSLHTNRRPAAVGALIVRRLFLGGHMRLIGTLLVLTVVAGYSRTDSSDVSNSGQSPTNAEQSLFDADELGTVNLPVSCNEVAAAGMEHGLALLHHMAYTEADLVFQTVLEEDPSCGMGYWGRAMTLIHPLWADIPTEAELDQGSAFVEQALALGPKTERERAYIDAVGAYFRDAHQRGARESVISFHQGWQNVHERFPEDWEATAFYALTSISVGRFGVGEPLASRTAAGALMEELLARVPDHPAGHHYLIHAYDTPTLAPRALEVARSYGKLTPEVPHALHMPTHIFKQLGLWSESIALNERSAAAAWEQGQRDNIIQFHYVHALSYQIYAYLQTGQDTEAQAVRDRASSVEGPFSGMNIHAFAAHLAEIPVQYALERHAWEEASQLEPRLPASFPWDRYSQFDAITYFGRTIGSARSGDARAAREALVQLQSTVIGTGPRGTASYLLWDGQTLSMAAQAWVEYAEGKFEQAVTTIRAAVERSTSLPPGNWPLTLPPGELLGDMYLELGRNSEALTTYEAVLERLPNRFNSLYGAGRSAELGGDTQKAMDYYRKLVEVSAKADTERESLRQAKSYLSSN